MLEKIKFFLHIYETEKAGSVIKYHHCDPGTHNSFITFQRFKDYYRTDFTINNKIEFRININTRNIHYVEYTDRIFYL